MSFNSVPLCVSLCVIGLATAFVFPPFPKKETEETFHSDDVVLLHVVFRHGDRTRDRETYPKDPYKNETFYPYEYGQLTNTGKNREYNIGKALRKRYDKFLGDLYTPSVLDARSTDFNRTKMSLELVLASLYPPKGSQQWLPGLEWQPIPYNYWKASEDFLLSDPSTNCPAFMSELNSYMASPKGMELYGEDERLYEYLSSNTGENMTNPFGPYNLFFVLATEEEWGLKLPSWTENVWPEDITKAGSKVFPLYTGNKRLKKHSAGPLLKKIIEDTNAKIQNRLNPQNRKIFLYSGHERNVGIMLSALGIYERLHIPPYGSYVLFEVSKVKESYGMRVYYEDYRKSEPRLMKIPGCSELCDLKKFESLIYDILPKEGDSCTT